MAAKTDRKRNGYGDVVARLVENVDFQSWLSVVLEEFCAFEHGYGQVDDFRQGIRAAGSWIMASLGDCDRSADMLANLYRKHFGKHGNKTQEEEPR